MKLSAFIFKILMVVALAVPSLTEDVTSAPVTSAPATSAPVRNDYSFSVQNASMDNRNFIVNNFSFQRIRINKAANVSLV